MTVKWLDAVQRTGHGSEGSVYRTLGRVRVKVRVRVGVRVGVRVTVRVRFQGQG